MNLDLPDFAVRGTRGIDLFRRREDATQRRARFVCIATVLVPDSDGNDATAPAAGLRGPDGRFMTCHEPGARRIAPALWQAVARFEQDSLLHQPFALGDAPGYPSDMASGAMMGLFPYVEFLRERLLAEMTVTRLRNAMQQDADAAARHDPAELSATLRLALDYNMIPQGAALWPVLYPLLAARAAAQGLPQGLADTTGYALRLLGDLRLRAGGAEAAAQALELFEAALRLGENPFRRRRAIEAAAAAGRHDACRRHLLAWPGDQPLPDDLRARAQHLDIPAPTAAASAPIRSGPTA
ncbi:MAG: hypothetical protein JJU19_16710 [Pararhodobacter sp.]|nr:hypothetical protein [Pararhodobacter sp.]